MNRLTRLIDRITKLPGQISKKSDELNDKMISISRDLDSAINNSATVAEKNLKGNKIRSIGSNAAAWVSDNLVAVGAVIGVLILISMVRK